MTGLSARIALLLLVASLAPRAQAGDFPDLTLPQAMRVSIVAKHMRMNGLDTRIYAFRSSKSADRLAAYFEREWHGQMTRNRVKPWDILAHHTDDYLITVQSKTADAPDTRTQGFIALTNVIQAIRDGIQGPKVKMPMLPNTHVVENLQANDQGRPSQTLILQSGQSAHQNLEFYRAYFKEQGYQPVSRNALAKDATGGAMILNRGNQRLNVAVAQGGLEGDAQTVITIVRVQR